MPIRNQYSFYSNLTIPHYTALHHLIRHQPSFFYTSKPIKIGTATTATTFHLFLNFTALYRIARLYFILYCAVFVFCLRVMPVIIIGTYTEIPIRARKLSQYYTTQKSLRQPENHNYKSKEYLTPSTCSLFILTPTEIRISVLSRVITSQSTTLYVETTIFYHGRHSVYCNLSKL